MLRYNFKRSKCRAMTHRRVQTNLKLIKYLSKTLSWDNWIIHRICWLALMCESLLSYNSWNKSQEHKMKYLKKIWSQKDKLLIAQWQRNTSLRLVNPSKIHVLKEPINHLSLIIRCLKLIKCHCQKSTSLKIILSIVN